MPKNGRKSRRREYIYEKGKNTIQYVIDGVLLIVCIMLTLVFEYQRNRSRDLEYVGRYIDELSTTTAIHVEDVFWISLHLLIPQHICMEESAKRRIMN